jgi:Cytochrome P460
MKHRQIARASIASAFVMSMVLVAQDKFTLKAPNGIAFSEFKGYEAWQVITPSQPDDGGGCGSTPAGCIKAILGNPVMIKAYADGVPADGNSVPDGAVMAKIEWSRKKTAPPPYAATVPAALRQVSFMVKDSKRFPDTDGWGYATFNYDKPSGDWKAFGDGPAFVTKCHACHTIVKSRDFVFTDYAQR